MVLAQFHSGRQFRSDGLDIDAQVAAGHLAFFHQLRDQRLGGVDGDGKPDALTAGNDRCVDSDHFALHVEERPTGVPRVDRSIGLDKVIVGTGPDDAAFGAHNPGRDRIAQSEGISDRQHPIPNLQLLGIAQVGGGQFFAGADLQHRQVRLGIPPDHLALEFLLIGQGHGDFFGAFHHMVVGENGAVTVDDDS